METLSQSFLCDTAAKGLFALWNSLACVCTCMCVCVRMYLTCSSLLPAFEALLQRHERCPYLLLLTRYCSIHPQARRAAARWRGPSAAPQYRSSKCSSSRGSSSRGSSSSLLTEPPALDWAVPTEAVSAFAVAAARKVVPSALLGCTYNYKLFLQRVRQFVCLNAKETFTVHQLMHRMQTAALTARGAVRTRKGRSRLCSKASTYALWDTAAASEQQQQQQQLQHQARRKLRLQQQERKSHLERILFFLFSHFVVPLLRSALAASSAYASPDACILLAATQAVL